jgi:hypothetical protein
MRIMPTVWHPEIAERHPHQVVSGLLICRPGIMLKQALLYKRVSIDWKIGWVVGANRFIYTPIRKQLQVYQTVPI